MASRASLTDEFRTESVNVRGTLYEFRELTAEDYDSIVKIAAGPNDEADLNTVLKMMTIKSLTSPKLTAEQLNHKPFPVYNKLLQTVNKLHFSVEEEPSKNGDAPNE